MDNFFERFCGHVLGKNQHHVSQVYTHYFAVQWASVAVVSLDNNHHFKWGGKNTE